MLTPKVTYLGVPYAPSTERRVAGWTPLPSGRVRRIPPLDHDTRIR